MSNPDAIPPDGALGGSRPQLRPWQKVQLIRDIAGGEQTYAELAEKWDRGESTIAQFAMRNRPAIEQVKKANGDALAALWIAQKASRVAEYQADAERLADALLADALDVTDTPAALVRARALILRSVAEELGQLTHKVDTTATVTYVVTGMDPEALK